jgi:hypothetical protein
MLLTVGAVSTVSADETTTIEGSYTFDDIGSNNYSYSELEGVVTEIALNALSDYDEAFVGGINSVFEPEYYSYVSYEVKTEEGKQLIEEYCQEHGYSDVVTISVNPDLEKPSTALGTFDITLGNSSTTETTIGDSTEKVVLNETPTGIRGDVNYDGVVNAVDLLLLKKYLLQIITW